MNIQEKQNKYVLTLIVFACKQSHIASYSIRLPYGVHNGSRKYIRLDKKLQIADMIKNFADLTSSVDST